MAAGAADSGDVDAGDGDGDSALTTSRTENSLPAMDLSSETLINRLREHAPICSERVGVQSLRMFGSWAGGTATPDSDRDLLVEFHGPATARRFYGLQLFPEDLLQQPIDLVTERALREELRSSVEPETPGSTARACSDTSPAAPTCRSSPSAYTGQSNTLPCR